MKKRLTIALMLLITLGLFAQTMIAPQGSGTEAAPYQIASWENLNWLTSRDANPAVPFLTRLGAYYIQTADITFPADITTWDDGQGFLPIGWGSLAETFAFAGNYDGQGHTISNLHINRPDDDSVALFGLVITGTIKNLGLVDVDIIGGWGVAGINGEMDTESIVNNCFVTGSILGEVFVGGISAYNFESEINNCYFIGTLEGEEGVGGIAGINDAATITNSYVVATIEEGDYIGMLAGMANGSIIHNSFWNSDLAGTYPGLGDDDENDIKIGRAHV